MLQPDKKVTCWPAVGNMSRLHVFGFMAASKGKAIEKTEMAAIILMQLALGSFLGMTRLVATMILLKVHKCKLGGVLVCEKVVRPKPRTALQP